jgi:hypothetical protein
LRFTLDLRNGVKTATFQLHLHLWENKEVGRAKSGEWSRCGSDNMLWLASNSRTRSAR